MNLTIDIPFSKGTLWIDIETDATWFQITLRKTHILDLETQKVLGCEKDQIPLFCIGFARPW
jgi:hypothetical protein